MRHVLQRTKLNTVSVLAWKQEQKLLSEGKLEGSLEFPQQKDQEFKVIPA